MRGKQGKKKLLIVGSGMATAKLLEELVALHADFDISVIGEESRPSYNRILLSSILAGEKCEGDALMLDQQWYRQHNVSLLIGRKAVSIDPSRNSVNTCSGETIHYDYLVLATGSKAHIPGIPGADADGVLGFRNLTDLEEIRRCGGESSRAVIVGGGLLGLEAAYGLMRLGVEVTVVHRRSWLMNRQLDEPAARVLERTLRSKGMAFRLGVEPHAIETSNGSAAGLTLSDGSVLNSDMILFAAGITPRHELALGAGLACNKAIQVDRSLRTSEDTIFALGECCEIDGNTFGLVAPVWQQAEVLAKTLCGDLSAGYQHREFATQLKVSGVDLFAAGDWPFSEEVDYQTLTNEETGLYRQLAFRGDQLVGAMLLGDKTGGNWYESLIRTGADISSFRRWIMFGEDYCRAA
ncbi:MAG: NAD(P)/FAD-dependent oxidoreductase [bacterium]